MSIFGQQIAITGSVNVVPNTNNTQYSYTFNGTQYLKNKCLGIITATLPYSWFNITASYGNNTFSYTWIDGTVVNITIPDGFYQVSDLNNYLQFIFLEQGHYLVDNNGDNQFYISLAVNTVYYSVQLNSLNLPSSLPSDWSYGTGTSPSWTTSNLNPLFTVNNSAFGNLIGYNGSATSPVSYPSSSSYSAPYSALSSFVGQITPVNSIIMTCNLVSNDLMTNRQFCYTFTPQNTSFGSNIVITPANVPLSPITDQQATNILFTFYDQNYNPLQIRDYANVTIQVVIADIPK